MHRLRRSHLFALSTSLPVPSRPCSRPVVTGLFVPGRRGMTSGVYVPLPFHLVCVSLQGILSTVYSRTKLYLYTFMGLTRVMGVWVISTLLFAGIC